MRPQHITAENRPGWRGLVSETFASMRPQHITAENFDRDGKRAYRRGASMRPQHITAENGPDTNDSDAIVFRFNEAAAYHCGKRGAIVRRPPVETALQ